MFVSERDAKSGLSVVFEDDGRVAYAYVVRDEKIIADVWVYNRVAAPTEPEWVSPDRAPFANARDFVREDADDLAPASTEADVSLEWRGDGHQRVAIVRLRGRVVAKVGPGMKPGFAVLARRDGPLARVLADE